MFFAKSLHLPPQAPPPAVASTLQFAEIPEIVFVNGLAETEQMGIYQLDVNNRWTPGDIDNASGWAATQQCQLIDESTGLELVSSHLSWNPVTAVLSYNGDDVTSTAVRVTLRMKSGSRYSPAFEVTVIRPRATWGGQTYQDLTGIAGVTHYAETSRSLGSAFTAASVVGGTDNCLLITPHTITTATNYFCDVTSRTTAYILGIPSKTEIGMVGASIRNIQLEDFDKIIFKNLNSKRNRFTQAHAKYVVMDKMIVTDTQGVDTVFLTNWEVTDYPYPTIPPVMFITNYYTTRAGSGGTKHPFYIHGRDEPLGIVSGGQQYCHFNNVHTFGHNNSTTRVQGSINIKCLAKHTTIRNTKSELTDNWADPTNGRTSSQLLSVHSHMNVLLYNCHFKGFNTTADNFGCDIYVPFQNRTMADSGVDDPAYFKKSGGLGFYYVTNDSLQDKEIGAPVFPWYDPTPTWTTDLNTTGWAPYQPNPEFHGTNTYASGVTTAPFWDTIGDVHDPNNSKLYRKFMSYCIVENVTIAGYTNQTSIGIRDDGTTPTAPPEQFNDLNIFYNVPSNWVERTRMWAANNTFIGITPGREYYNSFDVPTRHAYPYAREENRPPVNALGGDNATHIDLPTWFRYGADSDTPTVLESAASPLTSQSWSAALNVPSLNVMVARKDPEFPLDYPDKSRGTTAWIWGSRMVWDPYGKRILGVFESDGPNDDPHQSAYAAILNVYDENTNEFRVYDNPLIQPYGTVVGVAPYFITSSHLFDSNAIDYVNRRHYKPSGPYWVSGVGYVTPQINVIDMDKLWLGADDGAANLPPIPRIADYDQALDMRNTVAPVMDFFPTMGAQGSLVYWHCNAGHQKVWIYDLATTSWSEIDLSTTFPITLPNLPVRHGVGHYHPLVNKMIFGGGSYQFAGEPDNRTNKQFFVMSPDKSIVEVQQSPVVLSVNNQADARKACFAASPNSRESLAFHKDGNIYVFNWDTGTWSTRTGAMGSIVPDWACTIPQHNVIAIGDFAVGASKIYLYRN